MAKTSRQLMRALQRWSRMHLPESRLTEPLWRELDAKLDPPKAATEWRGRGTMTFKRQEDEDVSLMSEHYPPNRDALLRAIDDIASAACRASELWDHGLHERAEALARDEPECGFAAFAGVIPMSLDDWATELCAWRDAMREAASRDVRLPAVGDRFEVVRPIDRFPQFAVDPGAVGVFTRVEADEAGQELVYGTIVDRHVAGAEEWSNAVEWSGNSDTLRDLWADVRPTGPRAA